MDAVLKIIDFINKYWKTISIAVALIFLAYIVSSIMTSMSIVYSPYSENLKKLEYDVEYDYSNSTGYGESLSLGSIISGFGAISSKTIENIIDLNDAIDILDKANGRKGKLIIPANASIAGYENTYMYAWKKNYKVFFNQIDMSEIHFVFVIGNTAFSGEVGINTIGIMYEVMLYQLN